MPYISADLRDHIWENFSVKTPGELNYKLTVLMDEFLYGNGLNYTNINAVIGVLECAKLELYRRIAVPYEDRKKEENGDVYTVT